MTRNRLPQFIAALLCVSSAFADASEEAGGNQESPALELDPIVVVSSKRPAALSEAVGQVVTIDAGFIERHLVENADDLLRYEPGIDLESAGTRFGANAINIRGIGGNRVTIEVDGIPARDRFAVGSYSDGGRTLAETDRIKRVEILYGPASTLYGSDALGGVVAVTTWDPDDLLARGTGKSWYSLRGAYQGANSSLGGSAMAAHGMGRHGILFAATWRDGNELRNQASPQTPRDDQDWSNRDYFVRYTYDTSKQNRLRLTLNDNSSRTRTDIRSLPGNGRFRNTTDLKGDDRDDRRQASLEYSYANRWGAGELLFYDVETGTRQLTHEERAAARNPVVLQRYFQYDQDFSGLKTSFFRDLEIGRSAHHIGAGAEFQRTRSSEFRDGFQKSLVDGSITKTVLGENLPVRDFPISRTDTIGVFLQDEISLGDGRWKIVPAVRYDRYRLKPRPDRIYIEDNPETAVVAINEDRLSPRLGILHRFTDEIGVYAQYVNGFRAPPFEDANIGLDIPLFNIRALPNPDLRSETSSGLEVGFRYISDTTRLTLALFDTRYDDFIESRALVGVDPQSGVLLFQSRNIERARIRGLDLRLEMSLSAWNPALENWSLGGAAYWSEGDNRESGQPLNSVSPPQAVVGLSWSSGDQRWSAHLATTLTARQNRVDETGGERFKPPSWFTTDLSAGWRVNDRFDLRAGVYNLTDETYWRWSDVSLYDPANPMLELLSRPGRNWSVSARWQW